MVITEISMIHHVGIVLLLLWFLNSYNCCSFIFYFISLVYLYQVHETYSMRLRKKLQFEERKAANQRRVLTDSETVRWLNFAVEKMWPICIEPLVSQRIFLAIIPWFLAKYKPWTVKKAVVQHLYLGRTPPLFTEMRVLRESTDDDHLVLELGLNFLTADDMSAILSAKLTKRLGFGMVAKMHLTGMHVEGKVLIGVKFVRCWPFISRLRVCFAEPPYFQMTVKPLFNHGLDVTELPGIAGWLDKLLAVAFEETLVEPNMLVVDLEKFVSPEPGTWFSVDVKEPLAYVNVEVIEATEMKPSDLNGLADPYVKGHLGQYRFRTQVQKKTLTPKWQEEFKVPIISWDAQNVIAMEVRDKDHFVDDSLGNCSVNINDLRDGQRHDMWLPLENVKLGRLHLAVTVVDPDAKGMEHKADRGEEVKVEGDLPDSLENQMTEKIPITSGSNEKPKVADTFEAIDIEGQKDTGIWVHHPGSEVSQSWEPRKGKTRHLDTEIQSMGTPKSSRRSSLQDSSSSNSGDENKDGRKARLGKAFQKGFNKIFHKHPKSEDDIKDFSDNLLPSPYANVKAAHVKKVGVNFVMDDVIEGGISSNEGNGSENTGKPGMKDMAKTVFKNAGHSARKLKQVCSRKGSSKFAGRSEPDALLESDSSDEDSLSSSRYDHSIEGIPIASTFITNTSVDPELKEQNAMDVSTGAVEVVNEVPVNEASSDMPVHETTELQEGSKGNGELVIEQPLEGRVRGEEK